MQADADLGLYPIYTPSYDMIGISIQEYVVIVGVLMLLAWTVFSGLFPSPEKPWPRKLKSLDCDRLIFSPQRRKDAE